ncbi:metalloendopeptidase-like membrane protein [Leptolyngbyaceae cyanobacterium JSC-12]|nr:metalloendopeptidase-like membrane protein [Leptolyngbyaceae cyanobacterium JSC-12]
MAQGQLNAGSLGGRFLRRTIPQKGQPVPSRMSEHEAMTTQAKQVSPEGNRRVRTSAAMIGLAVSVGAYSLPLPHQGDQAVASEPTAEPSTSDISASFETAAAFSTDNQTSGSASGTEATFPSVTHTVQEGQTLWDVARFYGTDASAIAVANGLSLNSVLRVGQVLVIPTDTRIAQAVTSNGSSATPSYYGPVSNWKTASKLPTQSSALSGIGGALKEKQAEAVQTLRQKRENLRSSLVALNPQSQESVVSVGLNSSAQIEDSTSSVPSVLPSGDQTTSQQVQSDSTTSDTQVVALRSLNGLTQPNPGLLGSMSYRVNPGDTLSAIARAHGVSVQQLLELNRISDPNYIFVGQALIIPRTQRPQNAELQDKFNGAIAAVPSTTVVDAASVPSQPRRSVMMPSATSEKVSVVTPFTVTPQPVEDTGASSRLLRYNHVENLKLEIDRLRERYQSSGGRFQNVSRGDTRVVAASVIEAPLASDVSEPVNPEFNPEHYSSRVQAIRDRLRPTQVPTNSSNAPMRTQQPQVVAAAPLGSENYDPIKSRLGKTVSPELPPLGSGSEFLPGAPSSIEGYIWPTRGVLTSGYGWRWGRMHKGIDIAGPVGTPIVAAADGVVTYAGWNSGGYGYLVEIQHSDGSMTLYAHNNRILVRVGQQVAQGQQISEMGSTGYSTGPHLHFEVHPSGRGAVNPMAYLPRS